MKNRWKAKAPLPTERWYLAATIFEERIYAIGGCRRSGDYMPENSSVAILPVVEVGTLADFF